MCSLGCLVANIAAALACTWPPSPTKRPLLSTMPSKSEVSSFICKRSNNSIFNLGYGPYAFLDEVYETGDGTDAWCSTHQSLVTAEIAGWVVPNCEFDTCIVTDFANMYLAISGYSRIVCQRNLKEPMPHDMNFICA
jgi:hypothetical protein